VRRVPHPITLDDIARRYSERLRLAEAVATDLVSSGYEGDRWNGIAVLRLQLREEFRGHVDLDAELFELEFAVERAVSEATAEAFSHDEYGYSTPDHLGRFGICHYLVDLRSGREIIAAIEALPVVDEDERERILLEYERSV
jgi:hypothetical protein